MRPLRILLVTKSTGGVAEYVRQLALGLNPADFELTVACLSENGPEFAAELRQTAGVQAFSLQMNRYKVDPWSDAQVCLALARRLRQERYDLVHAHASKPGFLTRLAALGTGLPVLYSPHCFAFHAGVNPLSARLVALLEALAARFLTTRIVTVADGERELARQYGVGTDELFVTLRTGLDPRPYRQPVERAALKASLNLALETPLVGAVGRLSAQKAPLDFVRLAALVHQQAPEVHFAWVGSGPLAEAAVSLSAELGLSDHLHFLGHRTDIPALLQVFDCFVLPSAWEGFPIVLLEAMAAGAPVVATQIPGNTEAIRTGVDGLLVPVHNPAALAEAVLRLLAHPGQAEAFRESARLRVEACFSRRAMLEHLSQLYRELAAQPVPLKVQA